MTGPFLKRHPPTEQQKNPHPQLVRCRNLLQDTLRVTRKEAAKLATWMTDAQVDAVVAAGDAVRAVVDEVAIPEEFQ